MRVIYPLRRRISEGRSYKDVSEFYINSALRVREAYQIDDVIL